MLQELKFSLCTTKGLDKALYLKGLHDLYKAIQVENDLYFLLVFFTIQTTACFPF